MIVESKLHFVELIVLSSTPSSLSPPPFIFLSAISTSSELGLSLIS